jgi:hypothetical protein
VGRDEDIQAIVELGRRTRQPTPRWLWIAAAVAGVICVTCFAAMMLGGREPPGHLPDHPPGDPAGDPPRDPIDRRPAAGAGLGTGLVIGAGAGLVIGFSIGRQRRSHSSRRRP